MKRVVFAIAVAAIASVAFCGTLNAASISPALPAAAINTNDVVPAHYYRGHYYPYRWHGHYYRYRWHDHYYRYRWHGHYYGHRHYRHGRYYYW